MWRFKPYCKVPHYGDRPLPQETLLPWLLRYWVECCHTGGGNANKINLIMHHVMHTYSFVIYVGERV